MRRVGLALNPIPRCVVALSFDDSRTRQDFKSAHDAVIVLNAILTHDGISLTSLAAEALGLTETVFHRGTVIGQNQSKIGESR